MSQSPYAGDHASAEEDYYPELTSEDRNWAMLCHLIALLAMPFGFGHIVGPLVVWLLKRNDHPLIDDQGKESLNFQLSVTLYTILLSPLICVFLIGLIPIGALWLANIVLIIMASIKASGGESFRYPLTIRFIK